MNPDWLAIWGKHFHTEQLTGPKIAKFWNSRQVTAVDAPKMTFGAWSKSWMIKTLVNFLLLLFGELRGATKQMRYFMIF